MPYFPEKKPEPSGEETKQKKLTEKQSQLLRFCVAILSLLLILYGAVSLIRYIGDLSASRMTSRELREIYNQPTEPPAPEATEETTESSSPETAEDNAAAPSTLPPSRQKHHHPCLPPIPFSPSLIRIIRI